MGSASIFYVIVRVILDAFRAQFSLDSISASVFKNVCIRAKHHLNTAIHRYSDDVPNGDDDSG